ncbi:MAG: DUF3786 domain-containing protein [Lachnospiraceae bacterium]|nr:DUF3786 domain-containing protein [Lachnospiraceae bacterium]
MSNKTPSEKLKGEKAPSNYEIFRNNTRDLFMTYELQPMIDKLGLDHDENYIYFTYLNSKFRLNKQTGDFYVLDDKSSAYVLSDYEDALTLYDVFAYSEEGAKASGELVQIQNLSRVQAANSYAGEGIYERYGKEYSGKAEALMAACEAMGGTPYGKGDVAMRIPLFRDVYAGISFWEADDEFPPVLNIFVDSNMLSFMHYETVWYCCNGLLKHIEALVKNPK